VLPLDASGVGTLYGDMSQRMMTVVGQLSPRQEIYSIDECFIDLAGSYSIPTPRLAPPARKLRRDHGL